MPEYQSISIKTLLIDVQRKAIVVGLAIWFIVIGPLSLLGLKFYSQASAHKIIEANQSYISHLLMTNDLVEIHRQFNSFVSTGFISKINLTDPNGKSLADVESQRVNHFVISFSDSDNIAPSGTLTYVLNWNYDIPAFQFLILFLFGGVTAIIFSFALKKSILKAGNKITSPLDLLINSLSKLDLERLQGSSNYNSNSGIKEIDVALGKYSEMLDKLHHFEAKVRELAKNEVFGNIASQVSHDIRSPLSALNMMLGQLADIPEQKRLIVRNSVNRINDIANTLLQKSKEQWAKNTIPSTESPLDMNFELLPTLVENIVSEKRVQFRGNIGIEIESDLKDSYGAFVNVNSTELQCAISNLINNSIEAFPESNGRVIVSIRNVKDKVILTVNDNGNGISGNLLDKLGELGVTYGKEGTQSGSGLGVFHAKKTIEGCGGQFHIHSVLGMGTSMKMIFPKSMSPKWFLEKLNLVPGMQIISLDDDLSIHGIWNRRLRSLQIGSNIIEHINFTSEFKFKEWFITTSETKSKRLYLMDYELLNQNQTGLEIIEELGIAQQSILVTSRFEEPQIREKCEKLELKLLPKSLAGTVPIEIEKPREIFDAILVDDDEITHLTWNMIAKGGNKRFLGFYNPDDFFNRAMNFDFNTPIFFDSNLGNGINGADISKKAAEIGFSNIYLCTGYDPSEFPQMSHLKGIIGKDPQFSL